MERILDVGCGAIKRPGAVRLDCSPSVNPDVLHDLDIYPYPFEDSSFDLIICHHVAEHVSSLVPFMEELHRLLAPGGSIEIITPHYTSSNSWTDPTHKHHLGFYSFDFFCGGEGQISYYSYKKFEIESKRIDFQSRHRLLGIEFLANKFPRSYEKYLCWIFPARNMHITLRAVK